MIYATRGLLSVLLERARERDPASVTIKLGVTEAGQFDDVDLSPETPVFTHFYLPEAGQAVSAVFGVDLGTPSGQTPGAFISHPDGTLGVKRTDDLRELMFVAVPPWEDSNVAVFGRSGERHELRLLDVEPPEELIE